VKKRCLHQNNNNDKLNIPDHLAFGLLSPTSTPLDTPPKDQPSPLSYHSSKLGLNPLRPLATDSFNQTSHSTPQSPQSVLSRVSDISRKGRDPSSVRQSLIQSPSGTQITPRASVFGKIGQGITAITACADEVPGLVDEKLSNSSLPGTPRSLNIVSGIPTIEVMCHDDRKEDTEDISNVSMEMNVTDVPDDKLIEDMQHYATILDDINSEIVEENKENDIINEARVVQGEDIVHDENIDDSKKLEVQEIVDDVVAIASEAPVMERKEKEIPEVSDIPEPEIETRQSKRQFRGMTKRKRVLSEIPFGPRPVDKDPAAVATGKSFADMVKKNLPKAPEHVVTEGTTTAGATSAIRGRFPTKYDPPSNIRTPATQRFIEKGGQRINISQKPAKAVEPVRETSPFSHISLSNRQRIEEQHAVALKAKQEAEADQSGLKRTGTLSRQDTTRSMEPAGGLQNLTHPEIALLGMLAKEKIKNTKERDTKHATCTRDTTCPGTSTNRKEGV